MSEPAKSSNSVTLSASGGDGQAFRSTLNHQPSTDSSTVSAPFLHHFCTIFRCSFLRALSYQPLATNPLLHGAIPFARRRFGTPPHGTSCLHQSTNPLIH